MLAAWNINEVRGVKMHFAAQTVPDWMLLCLRGYVARFSATRDAEQAVSTDREGPFKPNVYERRPEAALIALPVAVKAEIES